MFIFLNTLIYLYTEFDKQFCSLLLYECSC